MVLGAIKGHISPSKLHCGAGTSALCVSEKCGQRNPDKSCRRDCGAGKLTGLSPVLPTGVRCDGAGPRSFVCLIAW